MLDKIPKVWYIIESDKTILRIQKEAQNKCVLKIERG